MRTSNTWERYAWASGILFVLALLAEATFAGGIPINQDDSVTKIATALDEHGTALLAIACLSAVYAVMFVVYLWRLYDLLRGGADQLRTLSSLVLVGGVLFVSMHAVSDIGITGLLGAKHEAFASQQGQFSAYTLYLMTFALDSVGDILGSLFALATGLLVIKSGVLPRWLGLVAILVGILFFFQGFGLGGVIALFGLILDLIGWALLLIFVLGSSVIMLRAKARLSAPPAEARRQPAASPNGPEAGRPVV